MNYLRGNQDPQSYLMALADCAFDYAGFNLLLGDRQGLWFYSNRDHGIRRIEAGIYGISNGGFDEPWPKLSSGKLELEAMLSSGIDAGELMEILTDHRVAHDHELPDTGVPLDIERMLSSRFIRSPGYGTRACSVVLMDKHQRVAFWEQNFSDAEHDGRLVQESFSISSD